MKTFKVYEHELYGYEAIKQGFSWPALFFGFIWAMVKKLWKVSVLLFLAFILINLLSTIVRESHSILLSLLSTVGYLFLWLIPALQGNMWREHQLETSGYHFIKTVVATNPAQAVIQVSDENLYQPES